MIPNNERSPVKSDDTLISILGVVRTSAPVRLSDVADELNIAKSTVHNHLATLERYGFIAKCEDGYDLGLQFLDYGLEARRRQEIFKVTDRVKDLADETGEQTWCIVEEQGRAIYLYGYSGRHSIKTREKSGQSNPLHCIAAGKAILAHLPADRVGRIIQDRGLEAETENTITVPETLREELKTIREEGVAFNYEERLEGIHAIAAPLLDINGDVFGAISIGGPANRLTKERLQNELTDLIRGATNEMEINIREQ